MRVGHHQNKSFIIAALTAVVVVGVMLTMGQVPLAVSQPRDHSGREHQRADPDGCGQPGVGNGAGDRGALERANDYDAHASQHLP